MLMRGGTSKGAYFLAEDLPTDPAERDDLLLRVMGSPDPRQIDGIGGAHPLTSKVAVVQPNGPGVDYHFLQVGVDHPAVSDRQNCGNLLAGIGPFAIERGLVEVTGEQTAVSIRMTNTGGRAVAHVPTPGGVVEYAGDTAIDGVPGTAAAIVLDFEDTAGSSCGALLPTGSAQDELAGVSATCVDNGMPTVVLRATDLGVRGDETPAELESNAALRERLERIRLEAGKRMNLGDVTTLTVPKLTIVSAPRADGVIATRTFIPHRVHASIGVLGAASVAVSAILPGSVAVDVARPPTGPRMRIEHPSGALEVEVELDGDRVTRTAIVRTARKLFDGHVFPRR
ncbi:4-oxalomesaconate tautomerase [Mycolicibacterium agri]|uniref:4-oxalomesaconate tautomerase n=2 Tax=Mycolicibacterium agri TaxID=36811 RepID=A0A2A7MYJ9_MYCAG|nr:4-oxalomesaconate tautomerase [Mycolicibacterium agri]PEG36815.1 4-oxalomesaconate tautomerase [Mycolicibacterium agri]GFG50699.1 FldA protein [Mycolicibacterium agri]